MTSLLTSSVSEKEASARLKRFYQAAECTTQVELAAFLGVRQSSISDAKKRKAIPADWLLTLLCKKYINPHWILTGEGPTHLHPCEDGAPVALPVQTIVERRPPQECSMDELMREVVRKAMVATN